MKSTLSNWSWKLATVANVNKQSSRNELHSYESMHVIVGSCFAALLLSVLINFDNEIIIFKKTKTKKVVLWDNKLELLRQKHCRSRQSNLFTQFLLDLTENMNANKENQLTAVLAGNLHRTFAKGSKNAPKVSQSRDRERHIKSTRRTRKHLCSEEFMWRFVVWISRPIPKSSAAFQPHQQICEFTRRFG